MTGPHPLSHPERFLRPYRAAVRRRPDDVEALFELGLTAWSVGRRFMYLLVAGEEMAGPYRLPPRRRLS